MGMDINQNITLHWDCKHKSLVLTNILVLLKLNVVSFYFVELYVVGDWVVVAIILATCSSTRLNSVCDGKRDERNR